MRVNILCPDGVHYVRAAGDGTLDAGATIADTWECFILEEQSDGHFALRTIDEHPQPRRYVRADCGREKTLVADRCEAAEHEHFTLESLGDGRVAIRTYHDGYWRAVSEGGSTLDCQGQVPDAWEAFTIRII